MEIRDYRKNPRILSIEFFRYYFSYYGYKITSNICTGAKTNIDYICPKGHKHSMIWNNFQQGKRCPTCKKVSKPTIKHIKNYLKKFDCILLSNTYIDCYSKLTYVCPTGKICSKTWNNITKKYKKGKYYTHPQINNINTTKENIPLFNTYSPQLNKYQKTYIVKKVINNIELELLGVECHYCKKVFVPTRIAVKHKISALKGIELGEQNLYCSKECKQKCDTFGQQKYTKWNKPNVKRWGINIWRNYVKERDNYTCQKCGKQEKIMYAHHIIPYAVCKFMYLDPPNGITLCKECHNKVHQIPGCTIKDLTNYT